MRTLKQIRDKIIDDLDLYEETFVDNNEIDAFINEGISKTESSIHTIYEDYYLSTTSLELENNTNLYDYPEDIYANKIRMILYSDGVDVYEVKRVRNIKREAMLELSDPTLTGETLKWYPTNDSSQGRKIRIFPRGADTGTLEIWYIRNSKQLTLDEDICDIDEFSNVVELHAKTQIYLKDGDPRAADSQKLEEQAESNMVSTLSAMIIDDDNEVYADHSHYEESV